LFSVLAEQVLTRDVILVVVTEALRLSPGAEFEINLALEQNKLVIPLVYKNAPIPPIISTPIREPFDDNYPTVFASLAKRLPRLHREHSSRIRHREKEIDTFRLRPRTVSPSPRAADLLQKIMERYERTSIIDTVATVERYDEALHSRLPFIQIGLRVPVRKDWIEAENRILLVDSLGSSVAFSERRLLQRIWLKACRTKTYAQSLFNEKDFPSIVEKLSDSLVSCALLAPVERLKEIAYWTFRVSPSAGHRQLFLPNRMPLEIIWSNKYAPLDSFILADRSATRLVLKPDEHSGRRISAVLVENEKELKTKVDFLVKTVISAKVVNRNLVKAFRFE
jgi:hypothetical protein